MTDAVATPVVPVAPAPAPTPGAGSGTGTDVGAAGPSPAPSATVTDVPTPAASTAPPDDGVTDCPSGEADTMRPHADYPHEPGFLYDCPGCEDVWAAARTRLLEEIARVKACCNDPAAVALLEAELAEIPEEEVT